MALSKAVTGGPDFAALKAGGMIKQRQKDRFTVRLKVPGGRMPLARLARVLEVARRHGSGYVHLTIRQGIEIPYVSLADLEAVKGKLAEVGQETASCGARVRVPTACGGCEYNPKGLVDTQAMALRVTDRFFGRGNLAHKFKMAFSGCPNDCPHAMSNDLGFLGGVEPKFIARACTACGICAAACREGAIVLDPKTNRPRWLREKCIYCGDCIRSCPADAWQAGRTGWTVRVGGKHGRHPMTGAKIAEFLPDRRVPQTIEAVLAWYRKAAEGKGRVRIGTLLTAPAAWRRFLRDLAPVLGEWAVRSARPPQKHE